MVNFRSPKVERCYTRTLRGRFHCSDESISSLPERKVGFGRGDLYISFQKDIEWSDVQSMGSRINNIRHELCPFEPRRQILLLHQQSDIYWISTENYKMC
jgi:hypothetical protein